MPSRDPLGNAPTAAGPSRAAATFRRVGVFRSAARMLVVSTPAVRCDESQDEPPALADQLVVSIPIALADLAGDPRKVVLDGPAGAVLEVDEPQSALCGEHVPWVRLAVQQLF